MQLGSGGLGGVESNSVLLSGIWLVTFRLMEFAAEIRRGLGSARVDLELELMRDLPGTYPMRIIGTSAMLMCCRVRGIIAGDSGVRR